MCRIVEDIKLTSKTTNVKDGIAIRRLAQEVF